MGREFDLGICQVSITRIIELIDFSNMEIKIIYCTKIYCFNKFFWKIIFQFFCQKVQCDSLYHKKEIRSQDIENGENNISFFFI